MEYGFWIKYHRAKGTATFGLSASWSFLQLEGWCFGAGSRCPLILCSIVLLHLTVSTVIFSQGL